VTRHDSHIYRLLVRHGSMDVLCCPHTRISMIRSWTRQGRRAYRKVQGHTRPRRQPSLIRFHLLGRPSVQPVLSRPVSFKRRFEVYVAFAASMSVSRICTTTAGGLSTSSILDVDAVGNTTMRLLWVSSRLTAAQTAGLWVSCFHDSTERVPGPGIFVNRLNMQLEVEGICTPPQLMYRHQGCVANCIAWL